MASNRLPVTACVEGDVVQTRPSDGGLATGLRGVAREWPVVWFGWRGLAGEVDDGIAEPAPGMDGSATVGISLDEEEVARFYRRCCNGVLWPVLHGWTDEPPAGDEDWRTYRAVNERYAEAILGQLRPGDRVWIHDYHLLLLPRLLRERRPDVPIGFFLHTPFPAPEVFQAVPRSAELLEGMLGADVVGFHTSEYAGNFLRAVESIGYVTRGSDVRVGGRRACVKVHPMGIDVDSFARLGTDAEVLAQVAELRARGGALFVGVDRLDYTKGIPQRLLAFERMLEMHPELRGQVSLVQVAVPSREEIGAYRDLREVVETLVRRINRRFGRSDWVPVDYLYGRVDLTALAALYRAADVMVVTSLRDGLNLVAKEFVATRADGDGVLILSEFAGAAAELRPALRVNPNRIAELAEAYRVALAMPEAERRERMRELRRAVEANNVFHWAAALLDDLPAPASPAPVPVGPAPGALPRRRSLVHP
ncbi:MAG TPA: trehalose-6-phosphate synthase [Longimicrobiales bacterium]|nr:trehalose-6-phosphate synthase [Longimicrobiales bacterium]